MAGSEAIPPAVQGVLRATQATHMAIVALAMRQERLESLRAEQHRAFPEEVSDAAQAYRSAEATVRKCIEVEVEAHKELLKQPLTGDEPFVKISIAYPPLIGDKDADTT